MTQTENKKERESVSVLVLGCGSIGKRHLKNLVEIKKEMKEKNKINSIFACDVIEENLKIIENELGNEIIRFNDYENALKQKPTIVVICTPTSMHLKNAIQAVEAGCSIFIEKPISNSLEGINELEEKIKEKKVVGMVASNLRFYKALAKVKELLQKEMIGRIISIRAHCGFYLPYYPKPDYRKSYSAKKSLGGGVILDAIHEFDYVQWLIGEIKEISCFYDTLSSLEIDTEDIAEIIVKFDNGAVGNIHLDYIQQVYRRGCEIVGEKGIVLWDYLDGTVKYLIGETVQIDKEMNKPCTDAATKQSVEYKKNRHWEIIDLNGEVQHMYDQMYVEELKYFIEHVCKNKSPETDIAWGKKILQTAIAAKQACEEKKVVKL